SSVLKKAIDNRQLEIGKVAKSHQRAIHCYPHHSHMIEKPDITVRRATLDDANLLSQLAARTFEETFAVDNTAEDMAAYLASNFSLAQQMAQLSNQASIFLSAEVDGAAAGYAKLHAGEPPESIEGTEPIELVRLYVSHT